MIIRFEGGPIDERIDDVDLPEGLGPPDFLVADGDYIYAQPTRCDCEEDCETLVYQYFGSIKETAATMAKASRAQYN